MSSINPFFKEAMCRQCDGSGEIPFKFGSKKCPLCNGVGVEPSDLGRHLIDFLKKEYVGRL